MLKYEILYCMVQSSMLQECEQACYISCSADFKPAVQVTYGCIILLYAPIQDGTVQHVLNSTSVINRTAKRLTTNYAPIPPITRY
jgi:hypothetical protein